jgi:L-rhamnose-H+ transport protein
MNLAAPLFAAAESSGVERHFAVSAVWAMLFTSGFVVNFIYCAAKIRDRAGWLVWFREEPARNIALAALMALMWVASFHLYGAGAGLMGPWGGIAGWPLTVGAAIGAANIAGLSRGEWRGAPAAARTTLALGLGVLGLALVLVAWSSLIHFRSS